jgi:hypothetical protein
MVYKMKKNAFLIILLLTTFNQSHGANPLDGYKGMKCESMLQNIYENGPDKKQANISKKYEALSHLKSIAGNLAKIDEENLDKDFKSSLIVARKELKAEGFDDAAIGMTRVERYEVNGKMYDVYIYPGGIVHHITSPLPKDENHTLASVVDCIPKLRDMNCVDQEKNTREKGYCETIRPKSELDLAPVCTQKFVEEYIDEHNCLIDANQENCIKLAFYPTATLGIAGGVAAAILTKKSPGMLEKISTWRAIFDKHSELRSKLDAVQKKIVKRFYYQKLKVIDDLIAKNQDIYPEIENLIFEKNRKDVFSGPKLSEYNGKWKKEAEAELKKIYEDGITAEDIQSIKAVRDPMINSMSEVRIKEAIVNGYRLSGGAFVADSEILGHVFGKGYKEAQKDIVRLRDEVTAEVYRKYYPNEKLIKYKDVSSGKLKPEVVSEIYEKTFEAEKAMRMKTVNPEKLFYYNFEENISIDKEINPKRYAATVSRARAFRSLLGFGAGVVAGELFETGKEVAVNARSRADLASCQKKFSLDNQELNFLNNEDVQLSGSQVKSDQVFDVCRTMYIDDTIATIENARKAFNGIPVGLCNIITSEKRRMEESMQNSLKGNRMADCIEGVVKSGALTLYRDEKNGMTSEIAIKRSPEEKIIYIAPFKNGDTFPNLSAVKVYKEDAKGIRTAANDYQNTFDQFYNSIIAAGKTINLNSPAAPGEEADSTKRKIERQRKYNAYMNQIYRNIADGCKGYGKIECEVLEQAVNVTPLAVVSKSMCGGEVFEVKSLRANQEATKATPQ